LLHEAEHDNSVLPSVQILSVSRQPHTMMLISCGC